MSECTECGRSYTHFSSARSKPGVIKPGGVTLTEADTDVYVIRKEIGSREYIAHRELNALVQMVCERDGCPVFTKQTKAKKAKR